MKNRKNINKIVRIQNPVIWDIVKHAACQTGLSHQYVFNILCRMLVEGYVIGSETHWQLFVRLTSEMKGLEEQ